MRCFDRLFRGLNYLILGMALAACGSGAVEFAPTEPPPDQSPVRYTHPGGSFSLSLPRTWALYEQHLTTLASASFSAPDSSEPLLHVSVINTGEPLDSQSFGDLIQQYQTQVRPDVERYKEESRQAMGDGSWRMTGLRLTALGATQQVNTFLQYAGSLVAVIDVTLPNDETGRAQLQPIVNSFTLHPDAALDRTSLSTLATVGTTGLSLLHVSNWTTPAGVFFITGEVANFGSTLVTDVPVRAVLRGADGLSVAEAVDTVMGYGIEPGGFAPFSLRFGQGQPALATTVELTLGGDWQPSEDAQVYGEGSLSWTDESTLEPDGRLIVRGAVTNTGDETVRDPRVVVTVFDETQRVIAAGFAPADVTELAPDETASFQLVIPEIGGQPANYIVTVQGLP